MWSDICSKLGDLGVSTEMRLEGEYCSLGCGAVTRVGAASVALSGEPWRVAVMPSARGRTERLATRLGEAQLASVDATAAEEGGIGNINRGGVEERSSCCRAWYVADIVYNRADRALKLLEA